MARAFASGTAYNLDHPDLAPMTHAATGRGWGDYWREHRLSACTPDDPRAAAFIERYWHDFFAAVPPGGRVLDIATGNGVLLLWAQRASQAGLRCTGVDLADIDPARFLPEHREELGAVRFIGDTPAERLPFPDGSFDVVVSQYGMEYAELEPALVEASRVLAPGGRLRWLAHVGHSSIVAQGEAQGAEIDLLLQAHGPFARMRQFVTAQRRGRETARATEQLTAALKQAQAHAEAHPPSALIQQLCGGILETANSLARFRDEDIAHWLAENERRLRALRQRIQDLRAATLDETRLTRVREMLQGEAWRDYGQRDLRVSGTGHCLGRVFTAVRV